MRRHRRDRDRGRNVTPGYEGNPEGQRRIFFEAGGKRWFRTGDQGAFDDEGYLRLTGRLKEIINRGGEKISPLEVDARAAGAIPRLRRWSVSPCRMTSWAKRLLRLLVLKEGVQARRKDIRDFAAERLATSKCRAGK